MPSSQDSSQGPVTIRAKALPSPEVSNEPVGLCETCSEAHEEVLRDDDLNWCKIRRAWHHTEDSTCVGLWGMETITQTLPGDEWPDLPRMTKSADGGCGFCRFLRKSILSDRFDDACEHLSKGSSAKNSRKGFDLKFRYERKRSLRCNPNTEDLMLIVKLTFETGSSVIMHFEIEASTAVTEWLGLKPPAIRNYEDEEITSFLKTQLSNYPASLDNDNCDSGFLPKRLIDVGGGRLRLIERNSIRAASLANPQYCALSYCWGPPEHGKFQIKTNKDNIGDHLVGLNFEQLPQVVKDAVTTARSLSIPYLWVDALCILQDDKSDWEGQCIQMNDIYGKARVTLIAASSRTCIEGFLNPEGEGLRFPYRSVSRPHIHGSFMMYFTHAFGEVKLAYRASESTKHKHPDLFIDLHNDLHFSQWARRGWTFQEHAMAKVHIVFGTTGVYFSQGDKYVSKDGKAGPVAQTSATSVQTNDELYRAWEKVTMFRYSAIKTSSFTKKEDLLPALSGLARQFGNNLQLSNKLPVKYIAGHWVDRLDFTLLWEDDATTALPSLEDIVNLHGQKPYLIPTWSYLTRNRGGLKFPDAQHDYSNSIQPDDLKLRSEINILDVHMPLVGKDRYGAIAGAALTLEGLVLHLDSVSWSEEGHRLMASVGTDAEIWFEEHENEHDRLRSIRFTHSGPTHEPKQPTHEPDQTGVHTVYRQELHSASPDHWDLNNHRVVDNYWDLDHDNGRNSCGFSPRNELVPLHVYQKLYEGPGPFSYKMNLDFQFKPGASSVPGKMRASFEKLLPRMTLLLVASKEKYIGGMSMDTNGYGLLLLRLEGASKNSFLRVGNFRPRGIGGGLLCLKRLMKKETIKLC